MRYVRKPNPLDRFDCDGCGKELRLKAQRPLHVLATLGGGSVRFCDPCFQSINKKLGDALRRAEEAR